jgi:hypothetical protein
MMARAATTREAGGGDASLHAQRLGALGGKYIHLRISGRNAVAYSAVMEA